jgi:Uma2 family endonuclease
VVWASEDRIGEMRETGDPTMLAPEICVEVMSESNDWEEMREKRRLYVEASAEEVWVVGEGGAVWFWDSNSQLGSSELASDFPSQL